MGKFEFKDRKISLEICGKSYDLSTTDENVRKIQDMAQNFATVAPDDNNEKIERMSEMVDTLLGPGSVKEIFSDRETNVLDLTDLVEFLADEITKENIKRAAAMNREQRRASKPKK